MDELLLPFQLLFMQQAFLITLLISVPMSLLSCYLVLKGWSLFGDAISHAVLPGVVVAYLINIPLAIGAFIAGMVCALTAAFVSERSRIKEDTALGIVFATMFGLGIVLYVSISTDVHLDHILFGDMLGVTWAEIRQTLFIAIIVSAFLLIWRKDLLVAAFDPQHGRAISLPMVFLHYGLLSAIALMAVAALNAVGIILAIAFL
ncbi:MAG: metal ABC transporter permease, partial [Pseudomonadota bacterium]